MANIIEDNNISILINHKKSPENDINWRYVEKRYKTLMPNSEICLGDYPKDNYSKSTAINNAAKKAAGDVFIIADSNIVFNPDSIKKGLDALKIFPLVIPFGDIIYINQQSTRELYRLDPSLNINENFFNAYKKEPLPLGYFFIVPRICFEFIGGFDEAITEWDEDNMDFIYRLSDEFGEYGRLEEYFMWNLHYERINYPLYIKGINVERILEMKYPLRDMSWDIRI